MEEAPTALELPAARAPLRVQPPEGDPSRSPSTGWSPWSAPVALVAGLILAILGGLIVELVALAFGARISESRTPAGVTIADTVVQDLGFVLAAVYFARLTAGTVRSWQFGLRRPGVGWRRATGLIALLIVSFILVNLVWVAIFHPSEEKLLKQLGTTEAPSLLVLSAALTCVIAPICEELLFRGYMFTALRNWRGTLPAALLSGLIFGAVHVGSAPLLDLAPLAGLGFGLCLLYRFTGSLYPGIVAHSLNNSIAFAGLEGWSWQAPVLIVASLLSIGVILGLCRRIGLIGPSAGLSRAPA